MRVVGFVVCLGVLLFVCCLGLCGVFFFRFRFVVGRWSLLVVVVYCSLLVVCCVLFVVLCVDIVCCRLYIVVCCSLRVVCC